MSKKMEEWVSPQAKFVALESVLALATESVLALATALGTVSVPP